VSREERRWCLAFGLVLGLATTLPYVWAYFREGDAWRFSGFVFGVEDGNSYLAKMLQGAYGAWSFRTPYTTAPQNGILAFLPYLLLGKLAAGVALHEQLIALYHAARFLATPLAVLATYGLTARLVKEVAWRRWATVLASVGGGVGWIFVLLGRGDIYGSLPLEFYSPETFGFLAYLGLPHLIVGRALLLFGLAWYLDASKDPGRARWAGAAFLVLGLFQPLAVISAWVVILAHHLLTFALGRRNQAVSLSPPRTTIVVLLISSPVVIYYGWLSLADPFVRAWNAQNIIRSPHPIHYLLAYGPLTVVALVGIIRRPPRGSTLLAIGWLLSLPFLAYAPVQLQRRLPDGVWVAIIILAAAALESTRVRPARRLGLGLAVITLPSALLLFSGSLRTANYPQSPSFIPSGAAEAYEALGSLASRGEAVMASFDAGNVLPAWAPVRVLIGHGPESVGLAEAKKQVEMFYSADTTDEVRRSILDAHEVRFVLAGPAERGLGDWDPSEAPYLEPVYSSDPYRIFAVSELPPQAAMGIDD